MKGGKEFRVVGIKEGGERVADVTRFIIKLKGDSTENCRAKSNLVF